MRSRRAKIEATMVQKSEVVAVAVFLALGFAFYVFFAPFVGKQFYQYIVMGIYTPLAFHKGKQDESTCLILQQILDLKRLQCTEGSNSTSFILCQEQTDMSSPEDYTNWKIENKLDQQFQHFPGLDSKLQHIGSPNLTSSSIGETTLQGDSIWQCKSPNQSGQGNTAKM